ncbi:hypothetical protein EVAR_84790_1 [Eumeta japonica]|uniref:Uncharacterized protein n=1 Tax=Eumeta variegata TaxID=151549 RepID=A0A4C1U825_EUMVA|nr:hypothetical protein EVAR_84790_1 [Eumeta japonica]
MRTDNPFYLALLAPGCVNVITLHDTRIMTLFANSRVSKAGPIVAHLPAPVPRTVPMRFYLLPEPPAESWRIGTHRAGSRLRPGRTGYRTAARAQARSNRYACPPPGVESGYSWCPAHPSPSPTSADGVCRSRDSKQA